MPSQGWIEAIAVMDAAGTAVANTTTETILAPDVTIPAGEIKAGKSVKMRASGKLSTTGTPTMTWRIRHGGVAGTLLAVTEAISMGSGVTNVNWLLDADLVCRVSGSSGVLIVMGTLFVHTAAGTVLTNVFGVSGFDAPAGVTVDLAADWALSLTGQWSAASASNTITAEMYKVLSEN